MLRMAGIKLHRLVSLIAGVMLIATGFGLRHGAGVAAMGAALLVSSVVGAVNARSRSRRSETEGG